MNFLARQAAWPYFLAAFAVMAACLALLDQRFSQAGLWALMLVSVTVGVGHGALDVQLLLRRFSPQTQALRLGLIYLLMVVLLGWGLSHAVSAALWLLLAMSIWHFGEDYARWDLPGPSRVLTRVVVGGAPVMLPIWLSPDAMGALISKVWQDHDVRVWQIFATLWVLLLVLWIVACGLPRFSASRNAWLELIGNVLLNLIFSPLMAFALYFGLYHAPAHIWRVWRTRPASLPKPQFNLMSVGTSFLITVGLGVLLWLKLDLHDSWIAEATGSLRWLVVALAALTLPHLVLVSLCASMLSGDRPARVTKDVTA